MLRRHVTSLRLALMTADAFSAMALFVALSIVRFGVANWESSWSRAGADAKLLAVVYGYGWIGALWLLGLYRMRTRWSIRSELIDLLRASLLVAVGTFALLFWFKLPDVSRQFLLMLFPGQFLLTFASRVLLRGAFAWARERGHNLRYMLIVGTGERAVAFADRVEAHRDLGLRVIGYLVSPTTEGRSVPGEPASVRRRPIGTLRGRPILGAIDDIEDVLHAHVVDEVAICLPGSEWNLVEPVTRLCEDEGKIVRIPLDDVSLTLPGGRIEDFDGIHVVSLVYGPDRVISLVAKRILDIVLSATALVVLSPLFLAIAAWIRMVDGPPVFFRQVRVGLHGRPFEVVKFRTMVPDAEQRVDELLALNEIRGQAFKVTDDPRLSRTGRILRRTSLDELPQFWNVLRGEMSIVGPRPPLPREVLGYDVWHRRRLSMKPGITGLWQVAARREPEFDRWVRIDLDYIDRWSLWLDLKIIARTVPAVILGQGR